MFRGSNLYIISMYVLDPWISTDLYISTISIIYACKFVSHARFFLNGSAIIILILYTLYKINGLNRAQDAATSNNTRYLLGLRDNKI